LNAIQVEICGGGGSGSGNGSYNYGYDEDRPNIFVPFMVVVVMFVGIGMCVYQMNQHTNPPNQQDPALTQYRQQQQRRQQNVANVFPTAPPGANTAQSRQEELAARGDLIRSNLFSHTLSEDDDMKNLASIISSSANGATHGEDGENGPTLSPSNGGSAGFLDTLRSALSTNRSSVRSANKAECSICLMEYSADETISWSKEEGCDHVYHQKCIVGWLSTAKRDGTLHDSCPLCRTKLVTTETNVEEA